ncbi:hypothetical protein FNF31_05805 [Cafeteria roenbergensis]|uniref:TLC domain-containing protein n=1 Tax=Cafeteria roenbergensis TaxID=33653 RepID=A0A5A8CYV8_CAFRO|nr:hypothetical protein FNF31_05805 [Cafeteria roenbergensis]
MSTCSLRLVAQTFFAANRNASTLARWLGLLRDAMVPSRAGTKPTNKLKMENLSVSLVHSVSSSVLSTVAVALAVSRGGLEGVLLPGDDLAAASAGVTVSYMVVDLFDALVTRQAPVKLPIIAHHLTIIAVMLMSNFSRRGELLLQAGLICEINSVFLHARALMKLLGMRMRDPAYLVAWALAWLTFAVTRVAIHFAMLVWMLRNFEVALPIIDTDSTTLVVALALSTGICLFDLAMAGDLWFAFASDRRRAAAEAAEKHA